MGLARVEQWNLGLSASAVAASLALETPHFATSLAVGALLEAINLGALRRSALRFFAGEMTRSWTGAFALRFLLLAAGIFLTLQAGAHPVAFLIGLSIAMPAVLIDAWLNRPPTLDPATLPVFLDDDALDDVPVDEGSQRAWDEDAREAAELAARDERLSLLGRLFPTRMLPTRMISARSIPSPSLPTGAKATPANANGDSDLTDPMGPVQSGPDETRR
jgi:hypothetical protein